MALQKGVNSYVTVDEANTYFADRLDVAAWTGASEEQKPQALVTATKMLDDLDWTGYVVSESQPLAFPRSGDYFDPRTGTTVSLSSSVPMRVQNATMELAYHLLNNDGLLDDTGTVESISIGGINITNIRQANKLPGVVERLVKPLLVNAGSNMWWRAN
ncbi:DnaT-like ssDNA-binding protein [Flavobacterium sp.]|jgi:hypothetical protein|uniref:DnaT-like ssDNA-binding protein n=1 Tax=Flavobacterium sp. TaxID=239 RepID=UPI0037BFB634